MKKSLVVLLIAVLALSAVFAADVAITVEGEVAASYVVDFDDGITATYNVPSLNGELAWELVLPVAKAGSEYPYIDVAGEIEVDLTKLAISIAPEVDFSTFAIVGEDWKVNFLAKIGTLDYAVSAIDKGKYYPTNSYLDVNTMSGVVTGRQVKSPLTYRWASAAANKKAVAISKDGIGTLTLLGTETDAVDVDDVIDTLYFKTESAAADYCDLMHKAGYKAFYQFIKATKLYRVDVLAVDAYHGVAPATTLFAVEGESAELKISEDISTQFGFGFAKKNSAMNAGFSTKSSYEDIYTVAADFGYDFVKKYYDDKAEKAIPQFSFDVASSFKYEMVSVDVYYANGSISFYNGEDLYAISNYQYYTNKGDALKAFYSDGKTAGTVYPRYSLLSAKATVEVEEIGTTFTFTGKDLLEDASLAYEAVNTYFDNYTFTFGVEAVDDSTIVVDSVSFLAEADYAEEVGVTSYAGITAYRDTTGTAGRKFYFFPVFEVGFAYEKNGFSFSVDFSSLRELVDGKRADYVALEKDFDNVAFTVKAGYEAEMFTLSTAVEFNTHETAAYADYYGWSLDEGLYVTAGIESDKLVDGATLSLEYESCELLSDREFGTLTAAVTVEF